MKAQHTPGPWYVGNGIEVHDRKTEFNEHGERTGETANRICLIEYPYGNVKRKRANAQLIAAAPDMMQMLERIYANAAESAEWIRGHIAPVIAQAMGEA